MKRLAALAVLVFSLAGCGSGDTAPEEGSMDEQHAELMRRPSIEEVTAQYNEMHGRIQDELTATFPWMRWVQMQEGVRAGCTAFDSFSEVAQSNTLGIWTTDGTVPDADWARAQQVIADITREYGFTPPETVVSRPSDHQIVGKDSYGGNYRFGTAKTTVMNGSTGCHLPQAEKDKQAPPPGR